MGSLLARRELEERVFGGLGEDEREEAGDVAREEIEASDEKMEEPGDDGGGEGEGEGEEEGDEVVCHSGKIAEGAGRWSTKALSEPAWVPWALAEVRVGAVV